MPDAPIVHFAGVVIVNVPASFCRSDCIQCMSGRSKWRTHQGLYERMLHKLVTHADGRITSMRVVHSCSRSLHNASREASELAKNTHVCYSVDNNINSHRSSVRTAACLACRSSSARRARTSLAIPAPCEGTCRALCPTPTFTLGVLMAFQMLWCMSHTGIIRYAVLTAACRQQSS